jgi:hypothetical protein
VDLVVLARLAEFDDSPDFGHVASFPDALLRMVAHRMRSAALQSLGRLLPVKSRLFRRPFTSHYARFVGAGLVWDASWDSISSCFATGGAAASGPSPDVAVCIVCRSNKPSDSSP